MNENNGWLPSDFWLEDTEKLAALGSTPGGGPRTRTLMIKLRGREFSTGTMGNFQAESIPLRQSFGEALQFSAKLTARAPGGASRTIRALSIRKNICITDEGSLWMDTAPSPLSGGRGMEPTGGG